MDLYDSLLAAIGNEFDIMTQIKKSARGEVLLVRHKENGTRYIFRHFEGSSEVYKKLLGISARNLPQIMEVGEKNGRTVLLEEYIQGDTLSEVLKGGLLSTAEAKKIARQLCSALWILHSMGMVHRDVKPEFPIVKDTTPNMMNPRLYTTSYNKPQGQQFDDTAVLSFIKLQYT